MGTIVINRLEKEIGKVKFPAHSLKLWQITGTIKPKLRVFEMGLYQVAPTHMFPNQAFFDHDFMIWPGFHVSCLLCFASLFVKMLQIATAFGHYQRSKDPVQY